MQKLRQYQVRIAYALENKITVYFIKLFFFIILYKLGEYTFNYLENTTLFAPTFDKLYTLLSGFINGVTVKAYSLVYGEIHTDPGFVIVINHIQTIQMQKGCTGLMQLFQVVFILVLFPMGLRKKLFFLPVSILIIIFASVLHYIILVPIAFTYPDSFTVFHNIISRVVFYMFFFINFVLWNRYSGKI